MISVRVPATSANLGPGFDCLGLAVDLYLEVSVEPAERDSFLYQGQGSVPDTPHNLVHQGFRAAFKRFGLTSPSVRFRVTNPIPLARGLGSSSAALVAGAALADAMLDGALGQDGVFEVTADIEGHPDNVAPAIYGGFTVSALDAGGRYVCQNLPIPARWTLLFGVPAFELPTSEARSVLPASYSRQDVIFTSSRSALWSLAVALDRPELLRTAAQDVVHEPYREPLIPGFARSRMKLLEHGAVAAYLSGAGPTLAAITLDERSTQACLGVLQNFAGEAGSTLALQSSEGYVLERYGVPQP